MSITLERGNTIRVPVSTSTPTAVANSNATASVQSKLNETTFAQYLDGFQEIQPADLVGARGRVRYAIDTIGANGRITSTQYRLGGWLASVEPNLKFFQLLNPYAKKKWSVQLRRKPGERIRLYYMAAPTSDETALMRDLLTKLENGTIRISRGR
jgi:hypothetical protein